MRLIAILLFSLFTQLLVAQGNSLKIQSDDTYYYPPNLEFEVLNEKGKIILTQDELKEDQPIVLEGKYTINIFTTWADGKDTFKVKDKALIALEPNKTNVSLKQKEVNPWHKNKPKVVDTDFKLNNKNYDAIIAFENDIFFNYINGQASITENGEKLELVGNYVAKTSKGYLKMSYNPESKEYWYVFTDTYNKIIYK